VAFNFRLNLQGVFRRLGILTGARLPQLEENIQMTMQVTDLSRLVPAPIEPRGMAGVNIDKAIGQFSTVQLQSLAGGGIFIERILLRGDGFGSGTNYGVGVTATDLFLAGQTQINVGGTPVRSQFHGGNTAVGVTVTSMPASPNKDTFALDAGIFVPNQAFFTVQAGLNERLDIALLYRELPSVEEAG